MKDSPVFSLENLSRNARVLSKEEFKNLHENWIMNDCEESFLEMLVNNLPLVHKLAVGRTGVKNIPKDDLLQSGVLGLMKAIEKFEPDLGFSFSTYAVPWINDFINREIDNNGNTIRIPIARSKEARKYVSVLEKLPYEKQNSKEVYELLKKENYSVPNFSPKRIDDAIQNVNQLKTLSLDVEGDEDEEAPTRQGFLKALLQKSMLVEIESHEEMIIREESNLKIFEVINNLREREREIIIARFGLNGSEEKTLKQLSVKFDITHERVRQIEKEALQKMKSALKRIGLENFKDFL